MNIDERIVIGYEGLLRWRHPTAACCCPTASCPPPSRAT